MTAVEARTWRGLDGVQTEWHVPLLSSRPNPTSSHIPARRPWGWRPGQLLGGDIPLHSTPRGMSSPGYTMGQRPAGCYLSHPICSTTVSCVSAEGSAQQGPGPWRPPCPAGCCGEWWRATTLALLSSLDALQVCVCTCGRTQAWPCFLAGKHVGPGVAGPLRCASGAGGDPSPPP